jgi:protein-S-isoprenylcysteine O-methyltransferase Ste14
MLLIRAIAAFLALPGMVAFAVPVAIGSSAGRPVRYVALAAVPPGLGMLLLLWCAREFYAAGRGTLAPWDPPQHLVTTGPYRISRNPMCIGTWRFMFLVPVLSCAAIAVCLGLAFYAAGKGKNA